MLIFRVDSNREEVFNFVCKIDDWLAKHIAQHDNWKESYATHLYTNESFQDNPFYQVWLKLSSDYSDNYRTIFENQYQLSLPVEKIQTIYNLKSEQWNIFQLSFQSAVNEHGRWVAYPELRDYFYAIHIAPEYAYLLPALQAFMDSMQAPRQTLSPFDYSVKNVISDNAVLDD
jgi:hypothetical protein